MADFVISNLAIDRCRSPRMPSQPPASSLNERLLKRQPELRGGVVPLIEALVKDEMDEIGEIARRILIGFEEGE